MSALLTTFRQIGGILAEIQHAARASFLQPALEKEVLGA